MVHEGTSEGTDSLVAPPKKDPGLKFCIKEMQGWRATLRLTTVIAVTLGIGLLGFYGLLKPISNGCIMTHMYPTYVPISTTDGISYAKYELYLYHEGWKRIDFKDHLKKLAGVPVLFIPGNGGSYKLASYLMASFGSHARKNDCFDFKSDSSNGSEELAFKQECIINQNCAEDGSSSSPDTSKSFVNTQLEIFHYRHGLLILHFLMALMFVPSMVAWLQRIRTCHSFPLFVDSFLCIGVIFHGIIISKPELTSMFSFLGTWGYVARLNIIYLIAGYYSYLSGLSLVPHRIFYAVAAIGAVSFGLWILESRSGERGVPRFDGRKHSHRH